jgi:putative peptidoglycan lipid II flippase
MQDTRTPFAVNVVENVLTVVFDVVLYPAMGVAGLALGFSLAYVVGALLAARGVSLRVRGLRATSLAGTSGRALAASAVMAAAVGALSAILPGSHGVGLAVRVAVCVAAGVAIYGATLRAEGVDLPVRVSPSRSPRGRSAVDRRASDRGGNG